MPDSSSPVTPAILSAWRGQLAATGPQRGLRAQLLRLRRELLPRFAAAYRYLGALPWRLRKAAQRRWGVSLAGVALLLIVRPLASEAATFTVRTAAELSSAITAANVASGADTIKLKADITLTTVDNTTYGPTGLPVVSSALTIVGKGHTIRRSPSAPEFRLLAVNSAGNLTVQNSTFSGGRAAEGESFGDLGGGIFNSGGEVTLEGCTVSGNTADGDGGGVFSFVYFSGGVTLTNSTVSGNSANGVGGGLSSRGGVNVTVALTNSTVSGNSAGGNGGGIYSCAALSTVALMNSTVSGNTAGGDGGGVFNCGNPETGLEITNSTVSGNSAGGNGGGVYGYVVQDGLMGFTNSTVSGNSAGGAGGGVFGVAGIFAEMRLTNSTVSGNSAGSAGGGVFGIAAGGGRVAGGVLLDRSLFSGNLAPGGAEVFHDYSYGYGAFIVTLNLFGHNELTTTQALSGVPSGGNNIVATSDGNKPTGLAAILDTTLQNNGGPTLTHNLVAVSPAIDAAPADANCPVTDQRGAPRPFGPACDIGAVEFGAFPSPLDCSTATARVDFPRLGNRHRYPVTISGVTTPPGVTVSMIVTSIFQDEPVINPTGKTCPDGIGVGTEVAKVRNERLLAGDGRVYHVAFTATDETGALCTGDVKACVPVNEGEACGDQGALFDSTVCP